MNRLTIWLALLMMSTAMAMPQTNTPAGKPSLELFCAAGIRSAAEALAKAYEIQHHATVTVTYAGSGQLLGQISSLHRGDLFMPGEEFYVNQAVEMGLADGQTKQIVAYFIPVIFVQKGNPGNIQSLSDLTRLGLRLGLGDERCCAVGKRALDLFAKNGIPMDAIVRNTVYKSGTVDELGIAVRLNHVDAALIWDVTARNFEKDGTAVPIPAEQNMPAAISIVVLKSSLQPAEARRFVEFVASDAAKVILKEKRYAISVTNAPSAMETIP